MCFCFSTARPPPTRQKVTSNPPRMSGSTGSFRISCQHSNQDNSVLIRLLTILSDASNMSPVERTPGTKGSTWIEGDQFLEATSVARPRPRPPDYSFVPSTSPSSELLQEKNQYPFLDVKLLEFDWLGPRKWWLEQHENLEFVCVHHPMSGHKFCRRETVDVFSTESILVRSQQLFAWCAAINTAARHGMFYHNVVGSNHFLNLFSSRWLWGTAHIRKTDPTNNLRRDVASKNEGALLTILRISPTSISSVFIGAWTSNQCWLSLSETHYQCWGSNDAIFYSNTEYVVKTQRLRRCARISPHPGFQPTRILRYFDLAHFGICWPRKPS